MLNAQHLIYCTVPYRMYAHTTATITGTRVPYVRYDVRYVWYVRTDACVVEVQET